LPSSSHRLRWPFDRIRAVLLDARMLRTLLIAVSLALAVGARFVVG
jgi:hypothetical protein